MAVAAPAVAVADHQPAGVAVPLPAEAVLLLKERVHHVAPVEEVLLQEEILPEEAVQPVVVLLQEEARDVNNRKD